MALFASCLVVLCNQIHALPDSVHHEFEKDLKQFSCVVWGIQIDASGVYKTWRRGWDSNPRVQSTMD